LSSKDAAVWTVKYAGGECLLPEDWLLVFPVIPRGPRGDKDGNDHFRKCI